jgi:hypothetical protein
LWWSNIPVLLAGDLNIPVLLAGDLNIPVLLAGDFNIDMMGNQCTPLKNLLTRLNLTKEASDCGGLYNTPIIALKLPVFISDQMISISSLLNSGFSHRYI